MENYNWEKDDGAKTRQNEKLFYLLQLCGRPSGYRLGWRRKQALCKGSAEDKIKQNISGKKIEKETNKTKKFLYFLYIRVRPSDEEGYEYLVVVLQKTRKSYKERKEKEKHKKLLHLDLCGCPRVARLGWRGSCISCNSPK